MSGIMRVEVAKDLYLSWIPGTTDIRLHEGVSNNSLYLTDIQFPIAREAFYRWAWDHIRLQVKVMPLSYESVLKQKEEQNEICDKGPNLSKDKYR